MTAAVKLIDTSRMHGNLVFVLTKGLASWREFGYQFNIFNIHSAGARDAVIAETEEKKNTNEETNPIGFIKSNVIVLKY